MACWSRWAPASSEPSVPCWTGPGFLKSTHYTVESNAYSSAFLAMPEYPSVADWKDGIVDSRSSKWRSTAHMFVAFGRGSMEGRAPMTFSASSYVVSVCTIFESWQLLRRLVVVFSGGRFGCVLRLVCGGASSNLWRRLRRQASELLRQCLLRRPIWLRAAVICGGVSSNLR